MWRWLRILLSKVAWPAFDCTDCIGMRYPHGCQCAAYDCVAPCAPPEPWRVWLRKFVRG